MDFQIMQQIHFKLLKFSLMQQINFVFNHFALRDRFNISKSFIGIYGSKVVEFAVYRDTIVSLNVCLGRLRLAKPAVQRGLARSQAPPAFSLDLSSQLLIGYHWLAFLNLFNVSEQLIPKNLKLKLEATAYLCIVAQIQLRWTGHVVRIDDERQPKQLFLYRELTVGQLLTGGQKKQFQDSDNVVLKSCHIPPEKLETRNIYFHNIHTQYTNILQQFD